MVEDPKTVAARFEAARLGPDYAAAMAAPVPRSPWRSAPSVIAAVVVLGGMTVLFASIRGSWTFAIAPAISLVLVVASHIAYALTSSRRELAIVVSSWSGLSGGQYSQTVRRSITLRFETGKVASYSATGGLSMQDDNVLGVACVRGRVLLGFERLDV